MVSLLWIHLLCQEEFPEELVVHFLAEEEAVAGLLQEKLGEDQSQTEQTVRDAMDVAEVVFELVVVDLF